MVERCTPTKNSIPLLLPEALMPARKLYPSGERGHYQFVAALRNGRTPDALVKLRRQFGTGQAGQKAFVTVAAGFCEVPVGRSEDGEPVLCRKKPVGTVDVDFGCELDCFPVCSDAHAGVMRERLVNQITGAGKYSAPGRNGFGRA